MPFSGSVSPNGATFPYWLLSNAHPSFGAILRKKGTVEVPLCVRIFVHGKWHWIWDRPGCPRISQCDTQMSLQKKPFELHPREPAILLGKTQGTHQEPTRSPPFYLEKHKEPTRNPPVYLEKHKEPTRSPPFYLEKHKEPNLSPTGKYNQRKFGRYFRVTKS